MIRNTHSTAQEIKKNLVRRKCQTFLCRQRMVLQVSTAGSPSLCGSSRKVRLTEEIIKNIFSLYAASQGSTTWLTQRNKTKLRGLSPRANQYRPSTRSLSARLMPTFADRGCHVVGVTEPYGRIIGFLDRSRYFFFQVAPQLYSRG
jgi:CBS-domain-containing membrane protein